MTRAMRPSVHPLHHPDTGTWSYVVADPQTRAAAIIDPVLDFEAKAARVATTSAQALLAIAGEHGYQVRWLLETHAHADHLSAADWLKGQLPGATLAIGAGIRQVQAGKGDDGLPRVRGGRGVDLGGVGKAQVQVHPPRHAPPRAGRGEAVVEGERREGD